jgi:hypothetical protein
VVVFIAKNNALSSTLIATVILNFTLKLSETHDQQQCTVRLNPKAENVLSEILGLECNQLNEQHMLLNTIKLNNFIG